VLVNSVQDNNWVEVYTELVSFNLLFKVSLLFEVLHFFNLSLRYEDI
jgi:hypothetical protein